MSRNVATFITFLVSAFGHELVMGCITKKLRGYGFVAQMLQLPIVAIQRTRVVRSRQLLNVSTPKHWPANEYFLSLTRVERALLDLDDLWSSVPQHTLCACIICTIFDIRKSKIGIYELTASSI